MKATRKKQIAEDEPARGLGVHPLDLAKLAAALNPSACREPDPSDAIQDAYRLLMWAQMFAESRAELSAETILIEFAGGTELGRAVMERMHQQEQPQLEQARLRFTPSAATDDMRQRLNLKNAREVRENIKRYLESAGDGAFTYDGFMKNCERPLSDGTPSWTFPPDIVKGLISFRRSRRAAAQKKSALAVETKRKTARGKGV